MPDIFSNDLFVLAGCLLFMAIMAMLVQPAKPRPDDGARHAIRGSGDLRGNVAWYTGDPDKGGTLVNVNGKNDSEAHETSRRILEQRRRDRHNDALGVEKRMKEYARTRK